MHFEEYISTLNNSNLEKSVTDTADSVWENISKLFDYQSHLRGLLLGHVQSGKTAQSFAVSAKMADQGFQVFLVLTTDNVYLQKQTLRRAEKTLKTFDIIGEYDDVKFLNGNLSKPVVVIIKKNSNILRKWRNIIASSGYCNARPLVVIDDEADAASVNNLINKNRVSTINRHLNAVQELASSSVYLQVTATPQAVLLQPDISGWKPEFISYFEPGQGYIGGDFIYSEPTSFCIRFTAENELDNVRQDSEFIPLGLRSSLMSFLVVCSHLMQKGEDTCNFLIHPSVKIADHETFADKIGEHLNLLLAGVEEQGFDDELFAAWLDLQITQPDITNFEDIKTNAVSLLEEQRINIIVLNSKTPMDVDYDNGFNIVVGGNSLGRGITLPKLQTVYYCRKSKTPQADTFWQHSRMFGYDREPGLLRIFTPPLLHTLFTNLNNANKVLINQIQETGIDGIQLIYPNGIKPTRSGVIDKQFLNLVTGGVNYFPNNPLENAVNELDDLLAEYSDKEEFENVEFDLILEILKLVGSNERIDWDNDKFAKCVKSLSLRRPSANCRLIVRRNRDISKGTGTLLSPTDRSLGDRFSNSIVLTLYRIKGSESKGWNNKPFWIPNIKFPSDACFYDTVTDVN